MKLNEEQIKAGARISQIAHPEYGTWIVTGQAHAGGQHIPGMWHVWGQSGTTVVDAYELCRFWQPA